eukprot:CAMPEP_0201574538 /NCGR_PEP_ID=MMETSP0190_2-20130828/19088_1 /ASSEMBLY_ACC=CAM_ASM_000263 /TAXON_ID=37353 /ORGANISM="Rosalina sp." /LENGTH=382 /DNA_ID=CAMNT_0048002905 /DNA_START=39 /DNA_END=1187 /DNA_ORIENTATION=-
MFPVPATLIAVLSILKTSDGSLYENCRWCAGEVCCDDPITDIDTLVCSYWTGPTGGAPLDVCFGQYGGAETSSVSQMYKCSDDGSTVNLYDYTGCSDCSCAPSLRTDFNVNFNPQANPERDTFNCSGDPCPYYILEDGTAHPSGECPFDVGKGGVQGGDYATWHVKLFLEGCQTSGDTSLLLTCSSTKGINVLNFGNDRCDFDPNNGGGNTHNSTLPGGEIECNKEYSGTGRAFYCSEETTTTTGTPTSSPLTSRPSMAPTTAEPTTADPTTAQPSQAPLDPGQTRGPSEAPTTPDPTTADPTTAEPTTAQPTTSEPTTDSPTTADPTTAGPTDGPTKAPVPYDTSAPTTGPNDVGNPSDAYRSRAGFYILFVMLWCIIYNR